MDLLEAMRTTPSTREFTNDPISDQTLYRILDHARFAPNGGNRQGWRVVVLAEAARRAHVLELLERSMRVYRKYHDVGLVPFAPGRDGRWSPPPFDIGTAMDEPRPPIFAGLAEAPVLLLLLADLTKLACIDSALDRQSIIGGGSIYPFAHNILLAARSMGLGGVLTTVLALAEDEVRSLIGFPEHVGVAGLIALGHPTRTITKLRREPVEAFTAVDRYDGPAFTVDR